MEAAEWAASSARSTTPATRSRGPTCRSPRRCRPAAAPRAIRIRRVDGDDPPDRGSALPIVATGGYRGRWSSSGPPRRRRVKVKVWGARGSVPAPGPETVRYGGNTSASRSRSPTARSSCSTPARASAPLGLALAEPDRPLHILLTHLHLDHIQGLMFFAPLFHPDSEIVIWGPASPEAHPPRPHRPLHLGAADARRGPRAAVRRVLRRVPRPASGRSARRPSAPARVTHRGPTLGYRITEDGASLVLHPRPRARARRARWTRSRTSGSPGFELARDADLLLHDCQYTDEEYPRTSAGATPRSPTR